MKTICLVACASTKRSSALPAQDLYKSNLFNVSRAFAGARADAWFVLSAKYGLLSPHKVIQPYDQTLVGSSVEMREQWGKRTFGQIKRLSSSADRFIFLAGSVYREFLVPHLSIRGNASVAPLANLGIGKQVALLSKIQRDAERLKDLDRLYELIARLGAAVGGPRVLGSTSGKDSWPQRGVYLFFEPSQFRTSAPFQQRLVRVGTHAVSVGSKTTLWHRLRTHRGAADLSGNHRGSIFRLQVGEALVNKLSLQAKYPIWGVGQSADATVRVGEKALEQMVSEYLGNMSLLWLDIDDEANPSSDRAYIERNIIALVTGSMGPLDVPVAGWLGQCSPRETIASSGLWNVNYVGERYDPRMLDVLEQYVEITIGRRGHPTEPLAPRNWRQDADCDRRRRTQLSLI